MTALTWHNLIRLRFEAYCCLGLARRLISPFGLAGLFGLAAVLAGFGPTACAGEASSATNAAAKPKIGIMKFDISKNLDPALSGLLYDALTEQAVKSRKFTVVDWEQIDRVLQYVAKSQPNLSPEDARQQAVSQLGIQQLYLGSAAKLGSKFFLSVKALNLDLSVEQVEKESVESEEQLVDAVAGIATRLLGLSPPESKPVIPPVSGPMAASLPAASQDTPWENSLGMKFVQIPGTKTLMGIWETRVQDYQAFVRATGTQWTRPDFAQGPDHPAVNVSWNDAMAFCDWLTDEERQAGRLNQRQTYRLPSDAEWSLAVGLTDEQGATPRDKDEKVPDVYPWGRQWPPPMGAGNYGEELGVDNFRKTSPVASFKPNKHGFFDLGGNVWEWCEDFYDGRSGDRVLRGGSWYNDDSRTLLSSFRYQYVPGKRYGNYGFRVVVVDSSAR